MGGALQAKARQCIDGFEFKLSAETPPNNRLQPAALGTIVKRRG